MAEPTETTPLLGSEIEVLINEAAYQNQQLQPEPEPEPEPEPQDSSIPAREHFKRPVKIITALILITSIIDLIFAIASEVVIDSGHFDAGAGYYTSDGLVLLGFFVGPTANYNQTILLDFYLTQSRCSSHGRCLLSIYATRSLSS